MIRTRTRCVRAERGDEWQLILNARGQRDVVTARVLVNAAGAWVIESFGDTVPRQEDEAAALRLDKGSHIVVPRLYDHDRAYILQAADRRVVFTIPFQNDFTLIGTTDGKASSATPPWSSPIRRGDRLSLRRRERIFPQHRSAAADVVWAYAGVRSLYDDGARSRRTSAANISWCSTNAQARRRLLTVYGGKITTYRRLAEDVTWQARALLSAHPALDRAKPAARRRLRL